MDERTVNDIAANAMSRPSVYVPALVDEITRLRKKLEECRAKHLDDRLVLEATAKAERLLRAENEALREALAHYATDETPDGWIAIAALAAKGE